jgi:hypothetical protein
MTAEVSNPRDGNCELCLGKANTTKEILAVKLPHWSGDLCNKHLNAMLKNGKKDSSLFDKQ